MTFSFVSIIVQISLLSLQVVSSFDTSCSKKTITSLNLGNQRAVNVGKLPVATSILAIVGNEIGRTVSIVCDASLQRKAVVFAHPLTVVLLVLLASSKFGRSMTKTFVEYCSNTLKSFTDKSHKASTLALSFAKAKLDDGKVSTENKKNVWMPAAAGMMASTTLLKPLLKPKIKVKELTQEEKDKAATAAIKAKIIDVEALEKAYAKAQKMKREAAQKASLAKAKAIEVEENRVISIAKNSRVWDDYRKSHDWTFRRWNKEQYLSPKTVVVEVVKAETVIAVVEVVEVDNSAQLKAAEEAKTAERIAQIIIEAKIASAKEEELQQIAKEDAAKRLVLKAAADKQQRDLELAYAKQLREKAAAAKAEKNARIAKAAAEKKKSIQQAELALLKRRSDEAFADAKRRLLQSVAAMEKTQSLGWTPHYMVDL